MSKAVLIFLLVTILAVISTPAAAAGLEKKWDDNTCCPIAICIFEENQNFPSRRRKRNTNKFDGFIQFTQTFNQQLYVTGFLDFENAQKEVDADNQGFDVHVVDCNQLNEASNLEGGLDLDHVDDIFDKPFINVVSNNPNFEKVSQVVGKCCVVAEDRPNNQHKLIGVAKVKQAVSCNPNSIVIGSDPN
ncbi:4837_t:CDS:1 [Paraglomus occultum]|uniref:4837_t:CDS:1 n=1 Tax=Paraglomus occultum TaxID=144539 RepID=A0A9N9FU50_9GLOM|nr:4837_t:CDS:1 [Paraglomus occultum]